ncbi:MAG: hypothetical protein LBJ31_05725, partial [Treponema sp.]|nr:hypothetical protein [Treponema sp.]
MGDMYSGDYAERLRRQLTENEDKIINTINQKRQSGENGVPQTRPLYKIHYTDEQYKYLRAMAEERKLSEDEIYRLNTAMAISENYNIPLDHVTKNLEAYVAGIGVDTSTALPKKWYIGVGKAFTNGLKGMRQGQLAWDLFTREMDGEDEITKLQRKRIADINRQIQFDSDYDPANLAVRALEDAAQSLPYTVYVGGAGILGSLLNPAVGTAAAWAAATQSMIGMEYYDLTEAGIDKDIARGTAFGSTFVQGGIEAFLGETVRLAGKGAMSLGGKKAMESLSRRIAGFVLPRMKTDGVFLNFAARQMVEMPLRMAEEGAEEGSQSLTASLSFNIAAALQNKRTYSEALSIMIGEGAAPEEAKQTLDALIAELKNGGKAEGGKAEELLNEKYVHQKKAREIVSDMNESFWGGVRAAAIFGTADIVLSAKTSRREAEKARFDAAQNPSKENFINEHKDGTISEDILGRIHDSQRTARDKSLKPDIDAAKELYALGPGVEKKQFDDEGKPVEVGSPFRKENGRL